MMRQTKACLNAAGSHLVETEKFMLCVGGRKITLGLDPWKTKKKKKVEEIYNPELTWTKGVTNLEEPEVLSERKLQKWLQNTETYCTKSKVKVSPI